MSRTSKAIFFGLLFLTATSQLIVGKWVLGVLLTALAVLGLFVFERREANRRFYGALRKLFVCADREGYQKEMNRLRKNAFSESSISEPFRLLMMIETYYTDERVFMKDQLEKYHFKRDYEFWRLYYLCLLTRDERLKSNVEKALSYVPNHFKDLASERVRLLNAIIDNDVEEISRTRSALTANLSIAEMTYQLAQMCDEAKAHAYYEKSAMNLSKGLKL
ncbi:MAG TPA: hypothetical protein DCS67_04685 [Clostridiales bacterium UBA8960]|jgi:hypothetical protein|nr:hypothetical protein [Clostridiales bacterium UBA8960]